MFKKDELKILWPFYLESILGYILNIAPVFMIVYFIDIGLSLTLVGILTSVALFFTLLFEIPTGAIADLFGRKFSVLLGYFLEGALFLAILVSKDFSYLLVIFILFGIAGTFSSGARDAWVVDLIKNKRKNYVHDYFLKSRSITGFAMVISGILGAFIVKNFGLRIIWYFAGAAFFLSVITLLFAEERYFKRKTKIIQSLKNVSTQGKESISYSYKHPILFYIFLAWFFIAFAGAFSSGLSWIPFLKGLNIPIHYFGYMWSATWGVTAIAPLFSKTFLKKGKEINFFIKMSIIGGGSFLLVYFVKSWIFAIGIMLFAEFFWEIQSPTGKTYFHRFIPRKLRATIGSVEGMVFSMAGVIGMPIAGYLIDTIGARYVIMLSGALTIPGILMYMMIKEERLERG